MHGQLQGGLQEALSLNRRVEVFQMAKKWKRHNTKKSLLPQPATPPLTL